MAEVEFPVNGWDGRMSTQSGIGGGVLCPGFDEDGHVHVNDLTLEAFPMMLALHTSSVIPLFLYLSFI